MGLTIDDIYDKEFSLKGGGYDRNDVDQFLDEICDEMTTMQEHIQTLEADLKQAQAAVEVAAAAVKPAQLAIEKTESAPVSKTSETLESILISAQRLADEAVENAKRRAKEIIDEAEEKAGRIVDDAQEEKTTLGKDIETLKKNASEYKQSFLALVTKHKEMLEEKEELYDGAEQR